MPRPWSEISETELARLLRGLPGREPSADLRARVLTRAAHQPRRGRLPRPAFALVSLIVLVLLDFLVLTWQDRAAGRASLPTTVVSAEQSDEQQLLDDLGLPAGYLMTARVLSVEPPADTYFSLRNRLLQNGEGS